MPDAVGFVCYFNLNTDSEPDAKFQPYVVVQTCDLTLEAFLACQSASSAISPSKRDVSALPECCNEP